MKKIILFVLILFTDIVHAMFYERGWTPYSISPDCPRDKPFVSEEVEDGTGIEKKVLNRKCVSCFDEPRMVIKKGHEKDFEICTNRETIAAGMTNSSSFFKKCPENKPLRNWEYGCVSCDVQEQVHPVKGEEDCSVCRDMRKMYQDGLCVLNKSPDSQRPLVVNDEENNYAQLFSCEELMPLATTKENCDMCANRLYYTEKELCSLRCENDQVATQFGCVSRNEKVFALLNSSDCDEFSGYTLKKDICVLKGYFFIQHFEQYRKFDGGTVIWQNVMPQENVLKAIDCQEKMDVWASQEACALCDNRKYEDGWCLLKESK